MTPEEIRSIRQLHSLTRIALAEKLQVRESTIFRWEQGSRKPDGPARILLQEVREGKR